MTGKTFIPERMWRSFKLEGMSPQILFYLAPNFCWLLSANWKKSIILGCEGWRLDIFFFFDTVESVWSWLFIIVCVLFFVEEL